MKRAPIQAVNLMFALLIFAGVSSAQVATGTPPFNSYGGGPFDVVNLGNLNVHFTIPVLHKAGRGLPFAQDLTFDNSIWTPVTSGGTTTWQPTTTFGWHGIGAYGGSLTFSTQTFSAPCNPPLNMNTIYFSVYTNWVYVDSSGTPHTFPITNGSGSPGGCAPYGPPTTGSGTVDGLTLSVNLTSGTITTSSGETIGLPVTPTATDANGNQITQNGGSITDTLGQNVLTIAGAAPSPVTFSYDAPSNAQPCSGLTKPCVKVTYATYTVKTNFGCSGVGEYNQSGISLVDKVTLADGSFYQFWYETTPGGTGQVTGRIAKIALPTGGTIQYTYDPSTDGHNGIICSDGSTDGLKRTVNGGLWTYTRTLDPNMASHWTTKVTTPPDPTVGNDTVIDFQKDSAGLNFYEVQRQSYQGASPTTLLLTTLTCWNGNTSNCTTTAVSSPISSTAATLQYPNSGLQSKTVTGYDTQYNRMVEVDQYAYASGAPTVLARKTQINYAFLGGTIQDHPSSVTVTDGTNTLSKTTYTYDESAYPIQQSNGTTQHTSVTGSRGNATTITSYINGTTTLSRHFQYYDTGTVYKVYDVNGAVTTFSYPNATSTCDNAFPTGYTLPISGLSSLASTTWNCVGGVAKQATDLNGNITKTNYTTDPYFWRPESAVDTAGNTTAFTYTAYTSSALAHVDSAMVFNSGNSVAEQLATFGLYGQTLYSQQHEAPTGKTNAANYDSTQVLYDSFLRANKSSMPCVSTTITFTDQNLACPSAAVTTSTFDALGRITQTTDGGNPTPGYVKFTYNQNDVKQDIGPAPAGENDKQKQLEYDALGRLTSVCELTSLPGYSQCGQTNPYNGYTTTYVYGVNGSGYPTTTVTQGPSGSTQTRVYTYDLLGRMISEQNPENGTVTYTYDSDSAGTCSGTYNGDLVKLTDAKGNKICYQYDALHRVTSITYPSSGPDSPNTPSKTMVYDSATFNSVAMLNPKGRLVEAYTGTSGSKTTDEFFQYSVRGELTDTWECTPHSGTNGCASTSNYYHVWAGFWANGALNTLNSNISGLPNQTYVVDGMGRTNGVNASAGQIHLVDSTGTSYDLANYKTTVKYGSGDSDVVNLDPNTGRMTKYTFNVGTKSDVGTTSWNPNGSLASLQITDTITSTADTQTCSYIHDDLSRISSVNCLNGSTNKWNQAFTYDAFGNITKTTNAPGIAFGPTYDTSKNWITALPGVTPTTDANGQMTYDGAHNYTWDAEHKMHSVDANPSSCSTSGECLTYDALGRMVEKTVGSTYTQIVYGPTGRFATMTTMNGQTTLVGAFIPLPGAQAVYTQASLNTTNKVAYYRHADHLGSSRLATTSTQTMYSSTAYAPDGEPYSQAGATDLSFTGQDQDTVPGIHDFLFRKFVPVQGRWLSPDPAGVAVADPTNPQSWNRYAYVLNNPMALTDPLGLDEACYTWFTGAYCNGCSYSFGSADSGSWTTSCSGGGGGGQAGSPGGTGGGGASPKPKPCTFTANVGDVSQGTKDAIEQIYNNAGVGVEFVDGPAQLTAVNSGFSLPSWSWAGSLGFGVNYGTVSYYAAGQVAFAGWQNGATQDQINTAIGTDIAHEMGHYMTGCVHGWRADCGPDGLMQPGDTHSPNPADWNPQSPDYQFTKKQKKAIQQKCNQLNGH